MADTAQDRTEPATPRRREEARKRGQVPKSTDLTAAIVLLGTVILLNVMQEAVLERFQAVIAYCLGAPGPEAGDPQRMLPSLLYAGRVSAGILLPVLITVTLLALVASLGQVGLLFTVRPITPSLDKLNPISGAKRLFSARSLVQLLMGLAKILVLSAVAYGTLKGRLPRLASASLLPFEAMAEITFDFLFTLGIRLTTCLLLLAIIDWIYQRMKHEKDLRMTKQEVREELKRMDGDPQLKRRRREIQMQLALQRVRSAVPKADVVVTNPTSVAVAIRYDSATMNAPRVVAKGADLLARRIRELAILHGVPIVERPPLARTLFRTVEVGQEIPADLYRAVAEVLAYVYELAGRGYRRRPLADYAMN